MLDLLLLASLGFLGSFGHCAGMCGPIAAAFSFSNAAQLSDTAQSSDTAKSSDTAQSSGTAKSSGTAQLSGTAKSSRWAKLRFHLLLNLGRILSYALVGAAIGALGSVLIAGGQMAGVGSLLRRGMALLTGSLLIWFGLSQVAPGLLPKLPLLHPLLGGKWHDRLSQGMVKLSFGQTWFTPFLLGSVWGLIPCGFLYAAQIKAAETGNLWRGMATMLAFGIGTMPMMVGVGFSIGSVSADRRSQLFRLGGWITLLIGILTLTRTGDVMSDFTGYGAILCLMLALAARPIARLWAEPLRYRRVLGVGAFLLALAHTLHMIEHSWQWNFEALFFMPVPYQIGIVLGGIALLLMFPAAVTSFDRAQQKLGKVWRSIHLLSVPALLLAAVHTISTGSEFLGAMQPTGWNWSWTIGLGATVAIVLLLRCSWLWSIFALEKFYVPPHQVK